MKYLDKNLTEWLAMLPKQATLTKYETHCEKHGKYVEANHHGNCMACLRDVDDATRQQRVEAERLTKLKNAGVGRIYHNASLNDIKPGQDKVAEELLNYDFDKNIVLIGKTGAGKTHLAIALINSVIVDKKCFFVKFYNLARLQIKEPERYQAMLDADFVVIDEFGVSDSDYKSIIIHEIYDYRFENALPTMLLSNLNPTKLSERLSDALYSRIKSNCLSLILNGDDLRLAGVA